MKEKLLLLLAAAGLLAASTDVSAGLIVDFNFPSSFTDTSFPYEDATLDSTLVEAFGAGSVGLGTGASSNIGVATGGTPDLIRVRRSGDYSDLSAAITNDFYIDFYLDGKASTNIELESFVFDSDKDRGDVALFATEGTYSSAPNAADVLGTIASNTFSGTISLSGITLADAGVSFRMYFYDGATFNSNDRTFSSDGGTIQVTAIPEPSTFALLAGVLGLGLLTLRRRR